MRFEGLAALRTRLTKKVPDAMVKQIRTDLETWAEELTTLMRQLVPADEGKLLASIGWTWGAAPKGSISIGAVSHDGLSITVYAGNQNTVVTNKTGGKWQNARIQEFGTKDHPAHPYFYPAYRKLKRRGKSRITRNLNKLIKTL